MSSLTRCLTIRSRERGRTCGGGFRLRRGSEPGRRRSSAWASTRTAARSFPRALMRSWPGASARRARDSVRLRAADRGRGEHRRPLGDVSTCSPGCVSRVGGCWSRPRWWLRWDTRVSSGSVRGLRRRFSKRSPMVTSNRWPWLRRTSPGWPLLVTQHDDLPLGTTDASVIALAERGFWSGRVPHGVCCAKSALARSGGGFVTGGRRCTAPRSPHGRPSNCAP